MLGAQGVQMGTRFLCAEECVAHENYKKKVLAARDIDTIVTGRRLGHPVRALKNPFTNEFARLEYDSTKTNAEVEQFGVGALRKAAVDGNEKEGSFLCGQIAGLVTRIQPAAEIIDDVLEGAEKLSRCPRMDKVAFVFAGQGAQYPGMGRDLYDSNALAREIFDRAETLRPGTLEMCFSGSKEELSTTINTQPCLFVMDYACQAGRTGRRHARHVRGILAGRGRRGGV